MKQIEKLSHAGAYGSIRVASFPFLDRMSEAYLAAGYDHRIHAVKLDYFSADFQRKSLTFEIGF